MRQSQRTVTTAVLSDAGTLLTSKFFMALVDEVSFWLSIIYDPLVSNLALHNASIPVCLLLVASLFLLLLHVIFKYVYLAQKR